MKALPDGGDMQQKPETETFLLLDGQVVCHKCLDQSDTIEKQLRKGDTYSEEPCDRCMCLQR